MHNLWKSKEASTKIERGEGSGRRVEKREEERRLKVYWGKEETTEV